MVKLDKISLDEFFAVPLDRLIPNKPRPFALYIFFELNQHLLLRCHESIDLEEERRLVYLKRGLKEFWCPNAYREAWIEYLKSQGLTEEEVKKILSAGEELKKEKKQNELERQKRERAKFSVKNGDLAEPEAERTIEGEEDQESEGEKKKKSKPERNRGKFKSKEYDDEENDDDDQTEESISEEQNDQHEQDEQDASLQEDEEEPETSDPENDVGEIDKKKRKRGKFGLDEPAEDEKLKEDKEENEKKKRKRAGFSAKEAEDENEQESEQDEPNEPRNRNLNLDAIKERLKEKKKRGKFKGKEAEDDAILVKGTHSESNEEDERLVSDDARSEEAADAIDVLSSDLDKTVKAEALKKSAKEALDKLRKKGGKAPTEDDLKKTDEYLDDLAKATVKGTPAEDMLDELSRGREEDSDIDGGNYHSIQVSKLAVLFGLGLGISDQDELADLTVAGTLHDIGYALLGPSSTHIYNTQHAEITAHLFERFDFNINKRVRELVLNHENSKNTDNLTQIISIADLTEDLMKGRFDGKKRRIEESFEYLEENLENPKIAQKFSDAFLKQLKSYLSNNPKPKAEDML